MKLYTERHGIRAPLDKTYCVNRDVYSLLLDCCKRYKKNLTHIFTLNCHHDFTDSDYVAFDEKGFITRMKIRIPALFRDEYNRICAHQCMTISPLTTEIENNFSAVLEVGTRELLKDAVALYKTPNPTARQDSVEKIWDAFERLKTYYTTLDKKHSSEKIVDDMAGGNDEFVELFNGEFKMLTSIGNKFRIRHHETDKIDIIDDRYYDYLFNRCLSLIALAIKYLV